MFMGRVVLWLRPLRRSAMWPETRSLSKLRVASTLGAQRDDFTRNAVAPGYKAAILGIASGRNPFRVEFSHRCL